MNDSLFIRHPYLAMVIAIVITLCGILAIVALPVAQYPDITPPQVNITTTYPGADALTLLQTVVEPIENQVDGVRDMIYLESTSANSGSVDIVATFDIGTDGERNMQNVQDRVNWATPQLPEAVQREGIIVKEQTGNILLAISLYSPGGSYDTLFMSNYAAINLQNRLKRVRGVSEVMIFGGSDYAMRVWLDAERMAGMGITVEEVMQALQSQNMQVSSGSVGAAPSARDQLMRYNVQTRGRLLTTEAFGNIIVRAEPGGAQVKMKDIADVELGAETYNTVSTLNGEPAVMLLVFQLSNANGLEVSAECRRLMAEAGREFPPDLKYGFQYDSTNFIHASIHDVVQTLCLAVLLVALVVLIFLQDWRMALVPTLAIPVSIVGTFAVLLLLGYSINLVTLFALILAIGIVVDDAIIVIENVSRLMAEEQLSPAEAAGKSMAQISGAIVATTAVLLAMFVPICFLSGITGELYRQFGVTLSVAVLLSAINALSLSPALSALLLRRRETPPKFFLFRWFNRGFGALSGGYGKVLAGLTKLTALVLAVYLLLAGVIGYWYSKLPTGFVPAEDQGVFFANVELPSGTALARTEEVTAQVEKMLRQLPGVADVIASPGYNILKSVPSANNAFVIVVLQPWAERIRARQPIGAIMAKGELAMQEELPEAMVMFFEPPPIPGIGMAGGFNFVLQQRSGTDPARLAEVLDEMLMAAMRQPELRNVFSTFNADSPYLFLDIDRAKALKMGVSLAAIDQLLENILGFNYVNDFNRFGQVYKVELQGRDQDRELADRILRLYVPNRQGQMVPMASLATIRTAVSAEYLTRYNLALAAQIQGAPAPGCSSGEAMKAMERLAGQILPAEMSYQWTDMSYQEQLAGNSVVSVFALAVVFIFLFLAALYGSWMLPWSVVLAIPLALAGALGLLSLAGIDNNIYTQIGIVLLFGMACKTAILIVDFAKKHHDAGASVTEAARAAAKLRFRAVLMTAFAFVFGTLPLAYAAGPGAASQRSIGVAVVGGMILAIAGGVLLIPLFFIACQSVVDWYKKRRTAQGRGAAE
ncbi:efflux RND transporter permease subunit [Victivallis sp. Marseille-Q1083]|uniref:efflux RND transporter permease subunit n=1 Tax=Victivallis sp. Marseille-Q1083 TaxID=2717288 RepID=UPI00158A517F|nr:efflux RND transporter permease subunit [Victivallis sp. Marseille-Q1083]